MINEIILITWRKFPQQLDERSDSKKRQLVALLPLGTATWRGALLPPLTVAFKLTLMCVCMHILENYFGAFCHSHVFVSSTMHTNSPFCWSSVVMLQSSAVDEGPLLPLPPPCLTLTHTCPEIFATLNTLMQKAFPLLQTVASSKKRQGEALNQLFFE